MEQSNEDIKSFFGDKNSLENNDKEDSNQDLENLELNDLKKIIKENNIKLEEKDLQIAELESQIKKLNLCNQKTVESLRDLHHDFENSKKRANDNLNNLGKKIQKELFAELLSLLDSFDRCENLTTEIKNNINLENDFHKKTSVFLKGFEIMHKEILSLFSKFNITKININEGDVFNEKEHNAISAISSAVCKIAPSNIVKVARSGYKINDEVLRYADVSVSVEE
ncbi:MAG: nucleotide exchange factor GrpE [Rickettsiales bacterium]